MILLRKRYLNIAVVFIIGLLAKPSIASEEVKSIIQGKITDQSGKPLIGADVLIQNEGSGTSSDENGFYYIVLPYSDRGREVMVEVQYMGYISKSKTINMTTAKITCDFQLETDILSLRPIVVNAQRREENIQKVPISIYSVSSQELEDRGVQRMVDLQYAIPNFYVGTDQIQVLTFTSIRGISNVVRSSGSESRASYYIDDAYAGRPYAVNRNLIDLERVELLRGPQGTLFGKNAISGAVHYTTKKPHGNWESTLGLNRGNLNFINTYTIINAPIVSNKLFARFSGEIMTRDGYIKNLYDNEDLNGLDVLNGRLHLRYLPNSSIDILMSINGFSERKDNWTASVATEGPGFDVAPDPREVSHDAAEYAHRDIYGGSLTVSYRFLDKFSLKSISAYQTVKAGFNFDHDSSPENVAEAEEISSDYHFTQELRFSTPVEANFSFITGLFYFYQKTNMKFFVKAGPEFSIPNYRYYSGGPVTTTSLAGYFNGNYTLSTNIKLNCGLRYTYEYKKIGWIARNNPEPFFMDVPDYRDQYSQGVLTPKLGVSYSPKSNILLYASIARGYASGGWSNQVVSSLEDLKFKPEFATSYEVGSKSQLFNNRFQLTACVFLEKFRDYQVRVWRGYSSENSSVYLANAARVSSKGIEMELSIIPWKNLSLSAAWAYQDVRYDEYRNAGGIGIHYDGNRVERSPETEYSFAVGYQRQIGRFGILKTNADLIHKDGYYNSANNKLYNLIPGYDLINGRLGFQTVGSSFSIYLWGKNLTNKLFILEKGRLFMGVPFACYAIPRTFGILMEFHLFK
jgi:iron complex outermembrane receptor protein